MHLFLLLPEYHQHHHHHKPFLLWKRRVFISSFPPNSWSYMEASSNCVKYTFHVWHHSTLRSVLNTVELKAILYAISHLLTDCLHCDWVHPTLHAQFPLQFLACSWLKSWSWQLHISLSCDRPPHDSVLFSSVISIRDMQKHGITLQLKINRSCFPCLFQWRGPF